MTGMLACWASSWRVCWRYTRPMTASTQRSRLRATSLTRSRVPSPISVLLRVMACPPSWYMPTSEGGAGAQAGLLEHQRDAEARQGFTARHSPRFMLWAVSMTARSSAAVMSRLLRKSRPAMTGFGRVSGVSSTGAATGAGLHLFRGSLARRPVFFWAALAWTWVFFGRATFVIGEEYTRFRSTRDHPTRVTHEYAFRMTGHAGGDVGCRLWANSAVPTAHTPQPHFVSVRV